MALTKDLEFFKLSEFKHPELVDPKAAFWLNEVRRVFAQPIILTDDARPPGVMPPGASPKSLHFQGRAFDIRVRHWSWAQMWKFVGAVYTVAKNWPDEIGGVELELVWSAKDKHAHLGFAMDGRPNRLIVAAD